MNTIYLEPNQVPSTLKGNYCGKKFKAVITDTVTVPSDAGIWGGGSRDTFTFIEIATGRSIPSPCQDTAPWDNRRQEFSGTLPAGVAMVEHSIFCGKDMGLTFYLRPENAQKLLPERVELTAHQKIVLEATRSYKSSYAGQDRYQMASGYAYGPKRAEFPTRAEWEAAKAELIAQGYLNKAGAITTKGRNAL